jgi:SAM-dependent methyltransferase
LTRNSTAVGGNPYSDADLADYYSGLDYAGTFQLAVRDLPDIIARQVTGGAALDFACGGGRSTRFLKALGFDAIGADVSQRMLTNAARRDPEGTYLLVGDGDLGCLAGSAFNLILSAFPFSSTTTQDKVRAILSALRDLLAPDGRLLVVEASDALYRHEWLSFSTSAYPENAAAKSGDPVPIVFRDRMDRPVFDTLWTDEDYRRSFDAAGLRPLETHRPLARDDDPDPWISEREIPPWVIYVLAAS